MAKRRALVGAFVVAGALLAPLGALAWACAVGAGSPFLSPPDPTRAPAGSRIILAGGTWKAGAPVEIRWNEVAVLATAVADERGSFRVEAVVPQESPGTYYLVGVQGSAVYRQPFEIPQPVTASSGAGSGNNSSRSPTTDTGAPGTPIVSRTVSGGTGGPATTAARQPTATPNRVATTPTAAANPAPSAPVPAASPVPAPTQSVAAPSAPVPASSPVPAPTQSVEAPEFPAPVVAGSTPFPTTASPPQAGPAPLAEDGGAPLATPSAVTAGDLWSGFSGGPGKASRAPSLLDLPARRSSGGDSLPGGAWLLSTGLVAVFSGFGLAELRRGRARAH